MSACLPVRALRRQAAYVWAGGMGWGHRFGGAGVFEGGVEITPKVKFLSSYAGTHNLFGDESPLALFGWVDHGEVFENCWKAGA